MDILMIVLQKLLILYSFIAMGFVLTKKKVISDAASGVLSKLLVNLFVPMMAFKAMIENVSIDDLRTTWQLPLLGLVVLLVSLSLSAGFSIGRWKDRFCNFYAFSCPNYGYIGYPIVTALFGASMLYKTVLYCLPLSVFVYTIGLSMFSKEHKSFLRSLLQPSIIAIVLGMICGLCGLKLPAVLTDILTMGSNCMSPIGMVLAGIVLARNSILAILKDKRTYLDAFVRLLLMPTLIVGALYLVGIRSELLLIAGMVAGLPCGLNLVVFTEASGTDSTRGARLVSLSSVMLLITIPFVFTIIMNLSQVFPS